MDLFLYTRFPFVAGHNLQILQQPPPHPAPRVHPPDGGPTQPATFGFEPGMVLETDPNWKVIRSLTKLRTCDPHILEWNERPIFEEWHRTTQAYEQFVEGGEDTINARIATGITGLHEDRIETLRWMVEDLVRMWEHVGGLPVP
ncbi:hypothetical protein AC578_8982 [Pseudocercospora eumusae]|uniref:Uncharacterized protein n=1 Tax=Pseudocercospora eumusae TaxID=321146 RepID=A0A139HA69_9PEZI|nr:hypothetical protein AC578_8982 [Pseudocercospora eumusae]